MNRSKQAVNVAMPGHPPARKKKHLTTEKRRGPAEVLARLPAKDERYRLRGEGLRAMLG
jgi:hypothetical protein